MGGRCDGRTGDLYTASVRVTIDSDQSNEMGVGQDLVGTTCLRADVPMQEKTPYEWHCALGHTNARNIKLLGKDPAHIDTDGPWQVGLFKRPGNISPIPAGSVHFLAITDDFTGYVWVYFYKEKSQFLSCLNHFKALVENQRKDGLKIQRARMDGAKEFSSHEAEALMKERDERQ
jgi:hypothetical protein